MTIRFAAAAVALAAGAALAAPAASAAPHQLIRVQISRGGACYSQPSQSSSHSGSVADRQITYWDGSAPRNGFLFIQCSGPWGWYFQSYVHEV
ncbi:hypothetical protein [Kutzneria sp. NPDC052558]|uniref:hypothetical protein n=1 Tax=Kutzneria sp. NPDC052558 TaxID=3364121 RepID=UPI0037C7A388